ncbi:MAG: hypothetical protein IT258_16610 [Saprospiraceae bacterium]|nr:hypothetical protein [Saprospiraceae bacterium]
MKAEQMSYYIESITLSSKRVRSVIVFLTITCVVSFAGFLNSFIWGWMNKRLGMYLSKSDWERALSEKYNKDVHVTDEQYHSFFKAFCDDYIQNSLSIKAPFFGISFDIN